MKEIQTIIRVRETQITTAITIRATELSLQMKSARKWIRRAITQTEIQIKNLIAIRAQEAKGQFICLM